MDILNSKTAICLLSLHLFQKYITLIVRNGLDNAAIADVTFYATNENGETQEGKSNSDGTIQLGPFPGRDKVTVKVEKVKFDSWNGTIQTLQSQVQVTLNPTVCSIFYVSFTALEYSVGSYWKRIHRGCSGTFPF